MQGLRIFSALGGAPSADEIDAAHRVAATHKEMGHGVIRQTDAKTGVTVEYHAFKRVAMTSRVGGLWFSGATGLTNSLGALFFVDSKGTPSGSDDRLVISTSETPVVASHPITPTPSSTYAPIQHWSGGGFYYTVTLDGAGAVSSFNKVLFDINERARFPLDGIPTRLLTGLPNTEVPWLYAPTVLVGIGQTSASCDGKTAAIEIDIASDIELFFNSFTAGAHGLIPGGGGAVGLLSGYPTYYYANSSQRISATGFELSDLLIGSRYAYQASDDSIWALNSIDPPVWAFIESGYNARTGNIADGYFRMTSGNPTITNGSGEVVPNPFYGIIDKLLSNVDSSGKIRGPFVVQQWPIGLHSTGWHIPYRANGTLNQAATTLGINPANGVLSYKGVNYSPMEGMPTFIYTDFIAARQSAADRHAAWAVDQATSLVPQTPSVAASSELQTIIDGTYGSALGGLRAGAPLTVVPVTKKVTSRYTGDVIGYMPAGMAVTFPATIEADSTAPGFATMAYNADLAAFVTQTWTAFEAPKTIGPSVVDVAFEATDLKLIGTTGDLTAQAKAQADLMQYTGVPTGFPYLGEIIETYRGAKEAVTGVPRPMKPWPPT